MTKEKIVVVTRATRLEELIARFNTRAQARFYIEHSGGDMGIFEREHETYHRALRDLGTALQRIAKVQVIDRTFLPNFIFGDDDLVVTIGIDGLVVNTAKYLAGHPLIAVNPDPAHIDGVLLPFTVGQAVTAVRNALEGKMRVRQLSMAKARTNDGQQILALNDLFIGRQDHVSARYSIRAGDRQEQHSSSGIIVSTGVGSTGWLSSLFNMADGILARYGTPEMSIPRPMLDWETDQLLFVVREPFASKTSAANIVCGTITHQQPLELESNMPTGGVIFSDGVTSDFLAFNAGAIATIGLAANKTNLVI